MKYALKRLQNWGWEFCFCLAVSIHSHISPPAHSPHRPPPDGEDPSSFKDKIIECARGAEPGTWTYMRVRTDKSHPNAYGVYLKVLNSIRDNITEEKILQTIDEITQMPSYTSRQTPRHGAHPPARPGPPHVPPGHANRPVQSRPPGQGWTVVRAPFAGDTDSPSDRPSVPSVAAAPPSGTGPSQVESKESSPAGAASQVELAAPVVAQMPVESVSKARQDGERAVVVEDQGRVESAPLAGNNGLPAVNVDAVG
jgi:hypothetical protein